MASDSQSQNAKLVQRYLGHSDVATTLRYYVDVFPEDLEEAAEQRCWRKDRKEGHKRSSFSNIIFETGMAI